MRLAPLLSSLAIAFAALVSAPAQLAAQGCTGPECALQQGGGHQCEREKKEDVTS